jgi:hypothetical protein
MLIISSPSMLMAFVKLRKRNLGPILDANGWAVNTTARINIPFGTSMTDIAKLPPGSTIDTHDRYAEKSVVWPKVVVVLLILLWVFAILWDTGILHSLTSDWKTPLGKPFSNSTNSAPALTNSAPAK